MKQKKAILAILTGLSMLMLMLLANLVVTATPDNKEIVWATTTEKSKHEGVEIKTRVADEKLYRLALHHPVFLENALNEKIEQYAASEEKAFIEKVNRIDEHTLAEQPASFSLSFSFIPVGSNFYSLLFETETYMPSSKKQQTYKTMMVDTAAKTFVNGRDLFINPDKAEAALKLPVEQASKQEENRAVQVTEERLNQPIINNNMYIAEDDVIFSANPEKKEKISLPLKKVLPYFKKEWRERIEVIVEKTKAAPKQLSDASKPQEKKGKKVALTFDDGPDPANTSAILTILKKHNAKATFFVIGSRVEFYPELVERIVQEGHEVGNHSWSHKDLTKLTAEEVKKELDRTAAAVETAAGVSPIAVRPPYGATNEQVKAAAGVQPVLWSVDTLDWKSHNPKAILNVVKQQVTDGSIILMHDIHHTTTLAVEEVVVSLQKEGYEFVTLDEL